MSHKRIVVLTDCRDVAFNELRAVILSTIGPQRVEIEPLVPVEEFSIINGVFLLRLVAEVYPPGTIFFVVLNPLPYRTERLIGRTAKKNFIFIGANTGVFGWFIKDFGCKELYELEDPSFFPFGGKYVHAPAVGKIVKGIPPSSLGKPFPKSRIRKIDLSKGTIVHIDNFGLIKFLGDLGGLDSMVANFLLITAEKTVKKANVFNLRHLML